MIYKLKKLFFLKPRKDCEQKYQEIFMNVWSAEQKQELIHLVKQQMHENCYVDFNDISQINQPRFQTRRKYSQNH
ncbi:Conserved_hypothetical protein [Hexamita inflata]|uniref:Uncharacterized protein n=1 Tax=Hexamita inflata TaxID=28002 RepID=A0AA86PKJ7_9EUKA|nr:Conserved hypothetical protein [Hexamita inflata]